MSAQAAAKTAVSASLADTITKYDPQPLDIILQRTANKFPNHTAIHFDGQDFDYKTLAHLVDRAAAGLQSMGVQKNTKVGLFMPNTPFSIIGYFAILRAGGTVVNYNPLYAVRELAFQVDDSETDIIITLNMDMLKSKTDELMQDSRLKKVIFCGAHSDDLDGQIKIHWDTLIETQADVRPVNIDPVQDTAVLQYTGGTTGTPKAAVLTHSNLYINSVQFENVVEGLLKEGQERILGVLPLFHVFSMTVVMNCAIRMGMEILLFSKFDPKQLAPYLPDRTPTVLPAVPAMYAAFASHKDTKDIDLSGVTFAVSGGAPIPPEVKSLFERQSGAKVVEAYGLTETSPLATANPPLGVVKSGSVGLPATDTVVEILSLEDGKTILPQGEHGEVCISGPQVMKGYFNKPDETAQVLKDGRLHTGDIGYLDQDGYLFLVDRLKDMILVSGFNVYPTQVESAVHMHPAVEECIVAGVPDDKRGEAVHAWVKLREGETLDEAQLKKFLRDKISATEMPRRIIFKDEPLPKTAVGKLSRKLLLEQEGIVR